MNLSLIWLPEHYHCVNLASHLFLHHYSRTETNKTTTLPSKNTIFEDPVQRNLAGKGSRKNMLIVT